MIKQLVKLANDLDSKGFTKEADALDGVINKISTSEANPGSAFSAAMAQGDEVMENNVKNEITADIQKTVDWFNDEVIPAIRGGAHQLSVRVPEDLLMGFEGGFDKPLGIAYRYYICLLYTSPSPRD